MIKNGECGAFNPLIIECLDEISDKLKEIADAEQTDGKKEVKPKSEK